MSANSIVEQPFRRGFNISTSRKEDKLANETVTKIKVVNRWVQALNLKNLRENNISSLVSKNRQKRLSLPFPPHLYHQSSPKSFKARKYPILQKTIFRTKTSTKYNQSQ